MRLASAAWFALAVCFVLAGTATAPAADEVPERIVEISPFGGAFLPDKNTDYSSASPLVGIRATLNNSSRWAIEGMLAVSPGQKQKTRTGMLESYDFHLAYNAGGQVIGAVFTNLVTSETEEESDSNLLLVGGSVVMHLSEKRFRPFLSAGAGFIDDISNRDGLDPPSPFSNVYWTAGGGFKYHRKSGLAVRLDIADHIMRRDNLSQPNPRAPLLAAERDLVLGGGRDGVFGQEPYRPDDYRGRRWLNNYSVSLSVSFPFGWAWRDGDGDSIEDRFDKCLTTAPGVVVDVNGCGIDSDQDGIFDGLDQCPDTPVGATVDLQGCPSDTDGDGVLDGIDQCADTPVGATVNPSGCPSDTDGDGVLDGIDACNDTPLGAAIDQRGCVTNPVEAELLLGETVRLTNVQFDPGSEDLRPLSFHYVNKVGRLLEKWTGNEERPLRIEIGVYTDGVGSTEYNQELSQRRAEAVRRYLLQNFYRMGQNNLVAVGYGESTPIADDATEAGRAANRRVEIRVLGPGDPPEAYNPAEEEGVVVPGQGVEQGIPEMPEMPDLDIPDLQVPDEPEMPDLD